VSTSVSSQLRVFFWQNLINPDFNEKLCTEHVNVYGLLRLAEWYICTDVSEDLAAAIIRV
jgi:hypothetical protein